MDALVHTALAALVQGGVGGTVIAAAMHAWRKRSDASASSAKAAENESAADVTHATTIAVAVHRITTLEQERRDDRERFDRELREEREACQRRETALDAKHTRAIEELKARLDLEQKNSGEVIAMAVARQDYAEQLEGFRNEMRETRSEVREMHSTLRTGVQLSERMVAAIEARASQRPPTPSQPAMPAVVPAAAVPIAAEQVVRSESDGRIER